MDNHTEYVKEYLGTEESFKSFLKLQKLTLQEEKVLKWAHDEFKKTHINTLYIDDAYRVIKKVKNISHSKSDTNSTKNGYTVPPKIPISEISELSPMPKSVADSVYWLYKSIVFTFIVTFFDTFVHHTVPINGSTLFSIIIGFLFAYSLIQGLKKGYNWVRLMTITLNILLLLLFLLNIDHTQRMFLHFDIFNKINYIFQLFVSVRVTYLLLLSSSSDWFTAKKIISNISESFTNTVNNDSKVSNMAGDLEKLSELKNKGILTEEEFLAQKKYLLKLNDKQ